MPENSNNNEFKFDILGDVLETLRFRGTIFFRSDLAAPWGVAFPEIGLPRFHIALSGDFSVGVNKDNHINVQHMGIVMLPHGESHWIADQPGRPMIQATHSTNTCELKSTDFLQGKITNRLMCGIVHYDQEANHPILDSLPQMLHFADFQPDDPIWSMVMLIDSEIPPALNCGNPVVDRLTEALFLKLINRHAGEDQQRQGFMAALRDRRIHQALALIHQLPAFKWSLQSLGERVGMSRATLIRHFQDTLGVSPMTYLSNWRLMKAYNLVKYSSASLDQIAESVGFISARTLSKAFQRHYGYTPSELRRSESEQKNQTEVF